VGKWINPRIHIVGFGGKDMEEFRIQGGKLHGLQVHDLRENEGERLVWLDEVAEINTSPVIGRLKVRYLDLHGMDPAIAWRAKLTSGDDPEEELSAVCNGTAPTPDPEYVWLGVQHHRQAKWCEHDPELPPWANGVEVVEAEDPCGCFGAVRYATPGGEKYYDFATGYYCELLVREY
jgi:hypothetical protein